MGELALLGVSADLGCRSWLLGTQPQLRRCVPGSSIRVVYDAASESPMQQQETGPCCSITAAHGAAFESSSMAVPDFRACWSCSRC